MLAEADYTQLSERLYEIQYGVMLYQPLDVEDEDLWYDGGDLDVFNLNLTVTKKERWAKNGRTSYLGTEANIRVDGQVTAKFMQKTPIIRAASLLGVPLKVQQAAGPVSYDIKALRAGGLYPIGYYGIGTPKMQYDTGGGALADLDQKYWRLVDPALGVFECIGLPNDAHVDADTGKVIGKVSGLITPDGAKAATRIDIGTKTQLRFRTMVRGLSEIGEPGVLSLNQLNLAPDGDIGYITGNDDFDGITLKGRAKKTGQGYGFWRSLPE